MLVTLLILVARHALAACTISGFATTLIKFSLAKLVGFANVAWSFTRFFGIGHF